MWLASGLSSIGSRAKQGDSVLGPHHSQRSDLFDEMGSEGQGQDARSLPGHSPALVHPHPSPASLAALEPNPSCPGQTTPPAFL